MSEVALGAAPGLALGLFGGGLASGLVPLVNAEALLAAAVAGSPHAWLLLVLGVATGQSTAKVLIYLMARDGPERLGRLARLRPLAPLVMRIRVRASADMGVPSRSRSLRTVWVRSLRHLHTPVAGTALVGVSAVVGLPPLAVVSGLAGVARLRLGLFVPACLVGRLIRFALIAWPVAHLLQTAAIDR